MNRPDRHIPPAPGCGLRPAAWALVLLTLAMPARADSHLMGDCATISDEDRRLACYDALAREQARAVESAPADSAVMAEESDPAVTATRPASRRSPRLEIDEVVHAEDGQMDQTQKKEKKEKKEKKGFLSGLPKIGLFKKKAGPSDADIETKITSIRKRITGHHVMTLANGQVWEQNEAVGPSIKADQTVVITKHRTNHSMKLASGRVVYVHRIR